MSDQSPQKIAQRLRDLTYAGSLNQDWKMKAVIEPAADLIQQQAERIAELEADVAVSDELHADERARWHETLKAFRDYNGDMDLWNALVEERDKLQAENERLIAELTEVSEKFDALRKGASHILSELI